MRQMKKDPPSWLLPLSFGPTSEWIWLQWINILIFTSLSVRVFRDRHPHKPYFSLLDPFLGVAYYEQIWKVSKSLHDNLHSFLSKAQGTAALRDAHPSQSASSSPAAELLCGDVWQEFQYTVGDTFPKMPPSTGNMAKIMLINLNKMIPCLVTMFSNIFYFPALCFQFLCAVLIASAWAALVNDWLTVNVNDGWSWKMLGAGAKILGTSTLHQHHMGTSRLSTQFFFYYFESSFILLYLPLVAFTVFPNLIKVKQIFKLYTLISTRTINCWQALNCFVLCERKAARFGPF